MTIARPLKADSAATAAPFLTTMASFLVAMASFLRMVAPFSTTMTPLLATNALDLEGSSTASAVFFWMARAPVDKSCGGSRLPYGSVSPGTGGWCYKDSMRVVLSIADGSFMVVDSLGFAAGFYWRAVLVHRKYVMPS